ncbi:hypothetical protein G7046_g4107 [Stylonectria norvegica]|nr:hypothetical protein G7046_g4107 [Stylonectria norvegica]
MKALEDGDETDSRFFAVDQGVLPLVLSSRIIITLRTCQTPHGSVCLSTLPRTQVSSRCRCKPLEYRIDTCGSQRVATPPHTHGGAAITATVIRGHVLNQMVHEHIDPVTGEKKTHEGVAKVYGPGETWFEAPGCHHVRSETVGDEEALFIANMVVTDKVFEGLDDKAVGIEADYAKIGRLFIMDKDVEKDV